MIIESLVLGPVMTNTYLVYNPDEKKGVVIDPGMEPASLVKRTRDLELEIEAILLTHAHFDHIGGVEEVRALTKAPVYVHGQEADWLSDSRKNGSSLFPGLPVIECDPAEYQLKGGEQLSFLGQNWQVVHTPGHSPGSITYVLGSVIFCGDVLFKDSIGRTDLPGGDHDTLMRTLNDYMMELSPDTRVLCGHGPETTIGREQTYNPFVTGML